MLTRHYYLTALTCGAAMAAAAVFLLRIFLAPLPVLDRAFAALLAAAALALFLHGRVAVAE